MRLSNTQAVARPWYGDRNPLSKSIFYNASGVAPHATTVRASYTVPVGKKAFASMISSEEVRGTVATAVGIIQTWIQITPSGGAAFNIAIADVRTNVVGDKAIRDPGSAGPLLAGDLINIVTQDTSTGGAAEYNTSVFLNEFDA